MAPRILDKVAQVHRPPRQVKPGTAPGRGAVAGTNGQQAPFVATPQQRANVRKYVACGFTVDSIAIIMSIPSATLERHFPFELQHGKTLVDAKILGGIVEQAFEGDKTMSIFWAKARAGWRDVGKDADGASAPGNASFTINISHGNGEQERAQGITIEASIDGEDK